MVRFDYDPATRRVAGGPTVVVADLPARGSHWTRTIAVGPDRRLDVSVGSSCNNCEERDRRRAAIYRYDADGRRARRSRPGSATRSGSPSGRGAGELWATVNGRDWLGDDRPAEYVTRVEEGGFYGWPYCHWTPAGLFPDPDLGGRPLPDGAAAEPALPGPHGPARARLLHGTQFPPEYRGDLFVALHGSWNHSTPVGYKVIRVRLDGESPRAEDFATGWVADGRVWGRPVDLAVAPDGASFSPTTSRAPSTASATGAADQA